MFLVPAIVVRCHQHAGGDGAAAAQAAATRYPGPPTVVGVCPLPRSHFGGRPGVPGVPGRPCCGDCGAEPGG
jgi:hypothetical protein